MYLYTNSLLSVDDLSKVCFFNWRQWIRPSCLHIWSQVWCARHCKLHRVRSSGLATIYSVIRACFFHRLWRTFASNMRIVQPDTTSRCIFSCLQNKLLSSEPIVKHNYRICSLIAACCSLEKLDGGIGKVQQVASVPPKQIHRIQ